MLDIRDIRKVLGFFHERDETFLSDLQSIIDLFDSPERYKKHLAKLEVLLAAKAEAQEVLEHGRLIVDEENPYRCFKLLSGVLNDYAKKHRFIGLHKIEVDDGIISSKEFRAILRSKKLIKDPGASPAHGDWEHAIQWFCVLSEDEEDSEFLSMNPVSLYASLGDDDPSNDTVWLALFDAVNLELPTDSLSNVIFMGRTITKNYDTEFPILAELMRRRAEKRPKLDDQDDKKSSAYLYQIYTTSEQYRNKIINHPANECLYELFLYYKEYSKYSKYSKYSNESLVMDTIVNSRLDCNNKFPLSKETQLTYLRFIIKNIWQSTNLSQEKKLLLLRNIFEVLSNSMPTNSKIACITDGLVSAGTPSPI